MKTVVKKVSLFCLLEGLISCFLFDGMAFKVPIPFGQTKPSSSPIPKDPKEQRTKISEKLISRQGFEFCSLIIRCTDEIPFC
jgi:hypothetical protein